MMRMSGWWMWTNPSIGTAAGISLPPRPRRCDGFWSNRLGVSDGCKHGGELQRVDLDSACSIADPPSLDLLALDEALSKLAAIEPAKADLVKLRFFAGLTMPEAAATLGISLATAERHWTFARSWLYAELADHSRTPVP